MIACREIVVGSPEHDAALQLRAAILREPLGLTWSPSDREDEPICHHLGAFDDGELVAVLLLKPLADGVMKMRQVAVAPDRQGQGIGATLIGFAEDFARANGCQRLLAHARGTALGFYRRIGYTEEGDSFVEQTIPHRLVWKAL